MASVRELAYVVRHTGPLTLGKRVYGEIVKDNVFTNAAAMAYQWVFAFFPLLIFLMTLVPYLPERYRTATPEYVSKMMYNAGLQYAVVGPVEDTIKSLMSNTHGGLLSVGLVLTLYAASGGMNITMTSLDTALEVEKSRPFWLKRLVAMALTILLGAMFFGVMVLIPLGNKLTELTLSYLHYLPDWASVWVTNKTVLISTTVRYVVGLAIMQLMIGLLFRFGPSRRQRLRFFTVGSLFIAAGWIATAFGLRYYFGHFNSYARTYGAVAGMVIMLLVFYLDAVIVLIGAELDNEVVKARYETPDKAREFASPAG